MGKELIVIGGGLAGCEAALYVANRGIAVRLYEMKPEKHSPAHKMDTLAELVCSNSLRSNDTASAPGLLKEEMRLLGSLVVKTADETKVPAGSALAVDREAFSESITSAIEGHDNIEIIREEVEDIPPAKEGALVVISSGPLTSDRFARAIADLIGDEYLYFYDAISPVVDAESINYDIVFRQSRYGKGDNDYINCPMDKKLYEAFIDELLNAKQVQTKDFEKEIFFEGCMPIEEMAKRGRDTLAFGPMKPVGLLDPITGGQPHAVVQLRQEDKAGSMYNLVGFQTRMLYPEQRRIFTMIPGLEKAEFLRLGNMHRNTYINSPTHLLPTLQLKKRPDIFFAGQISGVEGYIESAAMGILAGINSALLLEGRPPVTPPETTAMGSLVRHISGEGSGKFQPMNINFGLLPPVEHIKGRRMKKAEKRAIISERAILDMKEWAGVLK